MLIKCYGGPCDGQVIEIPQENDDCRLPSSIPMSHRIDDDEFRLTKYYLTFETDNKGWTTITYNEEKLYD